MRCLVNEYSNIVIFNWYATRIFFWRFYLFIFREKGGREKERERISMCDRNIGWLPPACSQLGTWLAMQACALTGNWTSDLLVLRLMLNPLSHTSQGKMRIFKTCNTWLFSQGNWSLFYYTVKFKKNDNSQHNNCHPTWMSQNYSFFFLIRSAKNTLFGVPQNFGN